MVNNISSSYLRSECFFNEIPPMIREILANTIFPWEALKIIGSYIEQITPTLCAKGYVEFLPGVWIGKDTIVSEKAEIIGPAIIGHHCEIRPGAYLRGNVITGDNCVIGNSTEIKNSILFDCVQIPHYNYVGDSILGYRSHLGAGAVCSNQKQDKGIITIHCEDRINTGLYKIGAILSDCVEIGCGCVLNPGTVIMKGTRIYPLISVRGVLPPNCIMKSQEIIETIKLP